MADRSSNCLYYGDNLTILREYIRDESVDLIYLDPPFNSNTNYNQLFKEQSGMMSEAQIRAFDDTWKWEASAERTFHELMTGDRAPTQVREMIEALHRFIGSTAMMAYLVMMTARLIELQRTLKPTGSIYLHCDPTASHYLKIVMDTIFGARNFRSEITWKRSHAHSDSKQGRKGYGNITDILLYYSNGENYVFNTVYMPYDQAYIDKYYRYRDPDGRRYWLDNLTGPGGASKGNPYYEVMGVSRYWRYSKENMEALIARGRVVQSKPGNVPQYKRYLDEMPGVPLQNLWTDIDPINMMAKERLGYPTQKPLALLERIIESSSNPGDTVLDPFCGCGTAVIAAQKLQRNWVGIDITHLAISLMKSRLKDSFNLLPKNDYEVVGEPVDEESARALAQSDGERYQFQYWAVSLLGARPLEQDKKKGADRGVDGIILFQDGPKRDYQKLIIQVKSGHVSSRDIRDLQGAVEGQKAVMGLFITLESITREMRQAAVSAGFYHSDLWNRDFPRIQLRTVGELLTGQSFELPPSLPAQFQQAPRVAVVEGVQQPLL